MLLDAIDDARARAAEISEARALAARDAAAAARRHRRHRERDRARAQVRRARGAGARRGRARPGRALARLRAHLREHAAIAPRLAAHGERLADLGHVFHPILEAFDADGRLVDHASDALGPLRRAAASIKAQLEKRMDSLLTDERFAPYLQDAYYTQREDRYVLPIRTDGKGFVRGIVHGTSQSGQTLFIEPEEIVDLNNRMKLAEADVADEERRIFIKFSGWIAEEADGVPRVARRRRDARRDRGGRDHGRRHGLGRADPRRGAADRAAPRAPSADAARRAALRRERRHGRGAGRRC